MAPRSPQLFFANTSGSLDYPKDGVRVDRRLGSGSGTGNACGIIYLLAPSVIRSPVNNALASLEPLIYRLHLSVFQSM